MSKPLAAYLYTKDSKLKRQFEANVSAGGMIFNDTSIHVRRICASCSLSRLMDDLSLPL
jgi:acyl-CoA reductase-like NAD-dependent aldehyde dehydrogenase